MRKKSGLVVVIALAALAQARRADAQVVVINEIMQNPAAVADSAGEWFELHNPGSGPIDINGWTIADNDIDSHVIANGGPLVLPAGGYLLLGNNGDIGSNGGVVVDYVFASFFLSNGADELVLRDGFLNEIDRVEWDGGPAFPDPNGASMALASPLLDNNVGANWCESTTPFGAGDLGTPGAANDCAGAALVINEFVANHTGTDTHEFIEVLGDPLTDYSTFTVVEIEGDGSAAGLVDDATFTVGTTDAGGYWTSGFLSNVIENGTVTLLLVENFTGIVGDDIDTDNDGLIDATLWDRIVDGIAVTDGGTDDRTYAVELAAFFDGNPFSPGGASRIPNGTDTDSAADWVRNDFDGAGLPGFSGTPDPGEALNTPGLVNQLPSLLVINEIDYDQAGTDMAEFLELKNVSGDSIDLDGLEIQLVNGNDLSTYTTISLPATSLAAGAYFVVCGDATSVANCDLDVSPSSNLIQNGAPDAVLLARGATILDAVTYEGDLGPPYTEGSGAGLVDDPAEANAGLSRLPDGADSNRNSLDFGFSCITPGLANSSLLVNCGATGPTAEIYEIQGSGAASPFAGAVITTRNNVVTAVGTNGFFMQTPTTRSDADVDTSDGIFVFTGGLPSVVVGDLVDVTGEVAEFFGLTEFGGGSSVAVVGSDIPPAAVAFDATVPSPAPALPSCALEFECYEGMLVEIAEGTVTGPNQRFGSDPVAEVYITAAPVRAFREPGIEYPGIPSYPVWDGNPEVFELDPDKLGLPNQMIPAGSSFSAKGVLGYEFGGYELWPTELTVDPAPLPRAVRPREPGELTVGSLNLFRLFDDIDDPIDADGRNDDVVSTAEYARRRAKLTSYVLDVLDAPDVLAVQEAESLKVLEDLAADVSAADPAVVYSAHLVEGNDVGTIDVGFLVRDHVAVDQVTQLGADELFTFDNPPTPLHDRPPLLLEGRCLLEFGSYPLAVLVVHNRSLRGIETERVQRKRLEQAESVAAKVQDLQTADPGIRLVVIGDFNAFGFTDGYVDAVGIIRGDFDPVESLICATVACVDQVEPDLTDLTAFLDQDERYSFIFRGSGQVLDHALITVPLVAEIADVAYGRGNADAALELGNDLGLTEPLNLPLRSSDHDGLVVFIAKDEDADGVPNNLDVCPGTVVPESVPTRQLGVNRFALVDGDGVFDTTLPPGGGLRGQLSMPVFQFDLGDTAGCSCEQIIVAAELGRGHVEFGCSVGEMREWVELVNP